jgi:hypothetical protein
LLGAALEPGALRSASGDHLLHQHSVIGRQPNLFREVGADGQGRNAEGRPAYSPILGVIRQHGLDGIDGNSEADA